MGHLNRKTTGAFLFSFVLFSLLLGAIFLDKVLFYSFLGGMAIFSILCVIVPFMISFLGLIFIVLSFGFFFVWYSWNNNWDLYRQGMEIGKHIIFSTGALSVWLLMYFFKKTEEQFVHLSLEVESLRKYDFNTGALKFNELVEKAKLIFNGMQRRGEKGFYLVFELKGEEASYRNRVILEKSIRLLLEIVRKDYDLISKLENGKMIVLLSNTDRNGVDVVLNRFEQRGLNLNLNLSMFDLVVKEIPPDWSLIQEELLLLNRGLAS